MSTLTGTEVEFGTGENASIGIIQSENNNNSAEVAEIKDETGKVILQKAFSKSNEKTFEAIFKVGTTPPAAGTVLTIASTPEWKGIVTASNITKSNTEFTKVSITAQKKDEAAVVAYA